MPSSHHRIPTKVTGAEGSSSQISPSTASRCSPFSTVKVCWLHFRQLVTVHQLDTSCPSSFGMFTPCPSPRTMMHDWAPSIWRELLKSNAPCEMLETSRKLHVHVFVLLVTKVYTNVCPQSSWLIDSDPTKSTPSSMTPPSVKITFW